MQKVMQKVKCYYILVFILFFILFFVSSNVMAMPAHPNLIKKMANEGQLDKLIKKIDLQRKIGIDNSTKTFPTTHNNARVLVILINYKDMSFSDDTTISKFLFTFYKVNIKIPYTLIPLIIFSILVVLFFLVKDKKLKKKIILVTSSIFMLFSLTACPNPTNTDINYFDNDKIQFYKNLFEIGDFSWKKYYLDMSNNKLNLSFDVVGPFSAPQGYAYYGGNNDNNQDIHPAELIGIAIDKAESAGVDFSQYDNNGDGQADAVIVIHAGQGEEITGNTDYIWSHRWNLYSANYYNQDGNGPRKYDNVIINDYTIQPEYNSKPGDTTIGVFCHEFGHILGLPDLYDYKYEADGVGLFSLMDMGVYSGPNLDGSRPSPLTAWERSILGWLTPEVVNYGIERQNFEIFKSIGPNANALKVELESDNKLDQYLFIEYIHKAENTWTEFIPGSGLMVLRIDQNLVTKGKNSPNSINFNDFKTWHHGVEIVEADNKWELWDLSLNTKDCFGEAEDLFSTIGNAVLSPSTQPNTNYYPGEGEYDHSPTLQSNVILDIVTIIDGTSITVNIRKQ